MNTRSVEGIVLHQHIALLVLIGHPGLAFGQPPVPGVAPATAQSRAVVPNEPSNGSDQVIYGDDDRLDFWQVDDPALREAARAAAVMVDPSEIDHQPGSDRYELDTAAWTSLFGSPVCAGERFLGQPAIGFCSAFLVAPDLVVTAGHCISASAPAGSVAFVFDFHIETAGGAAPSEVPAQSVYFVDRVIDHALGGGPDHAVVRLDRPVAGINPVDVRREGVAGPGTPVVMVGHPLGLPKKIAGGAEVKTNSAGAPDFQSNLDAYGGNSGSMVLNAQTLEVEGILVRGNADFVFTGSCYLSNELPDDNGSYEDATKASQFAGAIPIRGLALSALADPSHAGEPGSLPTPATIEYTLTNTSAQPIHWSAQTDQPWLAVDGASEGQLAPGGSTAALVTITPIATWLDGGRFDARLTVTDLTNGRTLRSEHTLTIGDPTSFTEATQAADRAIPDRTTIVSELVVATEGMATEIEADVVIDHTWIGDLTVDLVSPSGTSVRLHDRGGGSANRIEQRYDDDVFPPAGGVMAEFDGEPVAGTWRLVIEDHVTGDAGVLDRWGLRIFSATQGVVPFGPADIARPFGQADGADVSAFIQAFSAGGDRADLSSWPLADGLIDGADVAAFITSFGNLMR